MSLEHSPQGRVIRLTKHEDPTVKQRLTALEAAGHPVVCITLPTALGLGAECLRWKLAAVTASALLGVPPCDEPHVEDTSIPRELFGFARPQHAQALGNGQALAAKGQRGLRMHLPLPEPTWRA